MAMARLSCLTLRAASGKPARSEPNGPRHVQKAGASANSRRGFKRHSGEYRPSAAPAHRGGPDGRDLSFVPLVPVHASEVDPPSDRLERRRLGLPRHDRANDGGPAPRGARPGARPKDEDQWTLVFLGIVASWAALAAIVWELGPVKDMTGLVKAGHLALVAATILSAWTFLTVMFALHYAGVYFQPLSGKIRRGLDFPAKPEPGWGEFIYQAFVIGCTFASSDVNVTSTRMRRICRHSGRGVVPLQRDHSRPDHQYRGELVLSRRGRTNWTLA